MVADLDDEIEEVVEVLDDDIKEIHLEDEIQEVEVVEVVTEVIVLEDEIDEEVQGVEKEEVLVEEVKYKKLDTIKWYLIFYNILFTSK